MQRTHIILVIIQVFTTEYFLESEASILNRKQRAMAMRVRLVKMHDKVGDVFLTPFAGDKTVHVQCPFLDITTSFYMRIVGSLLRLTVWSPKANSCILAREPPKIKFTTVRNFGSGKPSLGSLIPRADSISRIRSGMDFFLSIGTILPFTISKFRPSRVRSYVPYPDARSHFFIVPVAFMLVALCFGKAFRNPEIHDLFWRNCHNFFFVVFSICRRHS